MGLEVYVLDNLDRLAPVTVYSRLEVVERDLSAGAWVVEMPLGEGGSPAQKALAAARPGIEIVDTETGWSFAGPLRQAQLIIDATTRTARFGGVDFQADLGRRVDLAAPEDLARSWTTSITSEPHLTTAAHVVLRLNLGDNATSGRNIPDFVLDPDPQLGPAFIAKFLNLPVLDRLNEWLTGSPYTCRLRLWRPGPNLPPVLRCTVGARPQAAMILSTATGTVGRITIEEIAASATTVIGMGGPIEDGELGSRWVTSQATVPTDWRTRYTETFINRPAEANDGPGFELAAEVRAEHAARASTTRISATGVRVAGYGRDLDLGWLVPIEIGLDPVLGSQRVLLPVVESALSVSAGVQDRTITVGSTSTPAGVAQLADVVRRIRRIERTI